jgi:hypothetical protein
MHAAGCIAPALRTPLPSELTSQRRVLAVPFHDQDAYQCGPAALAMALNWSGVPATPSDLSPQVFTPDRKGSLQNDLVTAARRNGRIPFPVRGMSGLLREVAGGRPVVVLQNLGFGWIPVWHYAVAIGFDLARGEVILHTGPLREEPRALGVFDRTWARSERWGQVVLEPGQLPFDLDEAAALEAIAGFERVDAGPGSMLAYQAAIERFPESAPAWMGLGNARYRTGDLASARDAFRRAAEIPGNRRGPALNNLAHVLSELGEKDEARRVLESALALGDGWQDTYRRTLQEIERNP